MTKNGTNTLWYSFGAASSTTGTAEIAELFSGGHSRVGGSVTLVILLWIAYFLISAFFFNLHRLIFLWKKSERNEEVPFWLPLSSGILFGPLMILITLCLSSVLESSGQSFWLCLLIPAAIGFELVRIGIRKNENRPNHTLEATSMSVTDAAAQPPRQPRSRLT